MGAGKDVSLPPLEPTASPGTEFLRKDDRDWLSALGESVSFGWFLSDLLEWDAMAHVSPPLAAMAHVQSKPEARSVGTGQLVCAGHSGQSSICVLQL